MVSRFFFPRSPSPDGHLHDAPLCFRAWCSASCAGFLISNSDRQRVWQFLPVVFSFQFLRDCHHPVSSESFVLTSMLGCLESLVLLSPCLCVTVALLTTRIVFMMIVIACAMVSYCYHVCTYYLEFFCTSFPCGRQCSCCHASVLRMCIKYCRFC